MMGRLHRFGALLGTWIGAFGLLCAAPRAEAESVADFYRGKTINLLVGSGEGGGFDLSARLTAQFLNRYLPGNPTIVNNLQLLDSSRRYIKRADP